MNSSQQHRITCVSCQRGRSPVFSLLLMLALVLSLGAELFGASRAYDGPIGYTMGSPDAPLEIVEYADFGCSACAAFTASSLPELRRRFVETGQVRWRTVVFDLGAFERSREAARAGECAHAQGSFWAMHDLLYAEQGRWTAASEPAVAFADLAGRAGLDREAFRACYGSKEGQDRLEAQTRAARKARVRGTPTFALGDGAFAGAPSTSEFVRRIEDALATRR